MGSSAEADGDYISCSLGEGSGSSHAGKSSSAGVRLSWALDIHGLIRSLRLSVASTLITLPRSLPLSSCLFLELQPLPRATCPQLCWSALSRLGPTGACLLSVLLFLLFHLQWGKQKETVRCSPHIQIWLLRFGQQTRPLAYIRILPLGLVRSQCTLLLSVSLSLYLGRKSDLPECER